MAKARFDHKEIEKKAQEKWETAKLYETDLTDTSKEKYYLLFEFPYPSGDLHVGHWYAFALTDIFARLQRMRGKNVLFPMGFDAFGLPAENAAMKNGADPRAWTYANMERMRNQVRTMGTSVDWSKEVVTCDPEYYKWTQWLFAKLYEHNLAERRNASVKWCPKDQTVLANEQVIDGKCDRCGTEVEEKWLTQWFLKITEYAERLLADLEPLPWREEIKDAQRAWIGKSEGAKIYFNLDFKIDPSANERRDAEGNPARIPVFTTRPDTIFGATYMVLAPEHPWIGLALERTDAIENVEEVRAYVNQAARKTERERSENKEKTGVELKGVKAINPATKQEIPIFVADYVLGSYGTGAVMAVPAHDERDFAFAKKFNLEVRTVVEPKFVAEGGEDAYRPGEEVIRREAICAVVYNPKDDTYLCNSWKTAKMNGLFTGGVDEGEDIVTAARREVHEETGYKNLRHIERPELSINTFFYHRVKQQNRWAHFKFVFFELENEERDPVDKVESDLHEVAWKKKDELKKFFTVFEGDYIVDHLDDKPYCYTGSGILTNSGSFSTRNSDEVLKEIVEFVGGEITTNYRLRDWLVSRQRYWGCPIPVVYDPEGNPHLIPTEHLPWLLPEDVDFTPTGKAPLASSKELHERVERIFGEGWTPEYDTLDTFVDSSWYYMRYLDPKDSNDFTDQALMKTWMPVDRYSGGAEHTTMHLLYSRFFYKALFDMALAPTSEPYVERFNRGLLLGPDGQKMSKSKGNVLNPDEMVAEYGADTVRMYLAFLGPYNEPGSYPWKPEGIQAMRRFLDRVVSLSTKLSDEAPSEVVQRALAKATVKVGTDTERFKYNTAISAMMVLVNEFESLSAVPKAAYQQLVRILAPYAPHLAEYLYETLGGEGSVHQQPWPTVDESLLTADTITLGVQVAGKRRGEVTLAPDASEEEALSAALAQEEVVKFLPAGTPSRVVYVPGRILNLIP